MKVYDCYLDNVMNSVHRNLRNYVEHGTKTDFLDRVIAYCEKLLSDPTEPKIKRTRIRSGRKIVTRR